MISEDARRVLLGGLTISLVATAGCTQVAPDVQLSVWAVSGSHRIRPDAPARRETDCFSHQDNRISLRAARNEVVACQLVLTTGTEPVERVSVTIGRFSGEKAGPPVMTVRAYCPRLVRTGRPPSWLLIRPDAGPADSSWPDALVPLDAQPGGQPFDLPAGTSLPIWIDLEVGAGVGPGVYRSPVAIRSGDLVMATAELQLQVLPFVLPVRPQLPVLAGVDMPSLFRHHLERDGKPYVPAGVVAGDPMAQQAKAVLHRTFRMLHAHRCSPFLTGLRPAVSLDASGRMRVGWDNYDRTVTSYLSGTAFADRQRLAAWPIPFDRSFPPPASYGGANSPEYAAAVQEYLGQSAAHFRQKGWLTTSVVWTDPPDPRRLDPPDRIKAFGPLVDKAKAKLRLLTTAIPQSMKPFGWSNHAFDPSIADLVSIWAPPAQFYDDTTMAKQRALGRTSWMTVDRPPYSPSLSIAAPQVDPRALPWQAFRYNIGGLVLPRINDWTDNPLSSVAPADSQWLVYPGKPFGIAGPIPSVRLKQLRRGLQDLEYLTLLKRNGQGKLADTIARILFRYGGTAAYNDHFADGCQWSWVDQPELWDLARRLMADRIAQIKGGDRATPDDQFVQTVEWRRLVDAACRLRVWCEGVRIRSAEKAGTTGASEVELRLIIRNERPTPVTGQLRFGKLPVGWRSVADKLPVKALPSLGRARLSLVAQASSIGTNEAGVAYVPVVFDAGSAGKIEIQARLTQITVRRLNQPIVVDGDLSGWPPGIRNVASDFIVVAGQDPALAGKEPTGRARQQTMALVGLHRDRLHFAFNCRDDQVGKLPSTGSNFVRYDGLLPADDDLLEILIDPTNAGTGQPIDIYRVVIRPTGSVLVRQGVSTGTGWGTSRYWPADVRVAAARQDQGWTVEASVPLSAFGRAALANKRWAINFARYQPRVGEYSSWSGARRYFYNTRSFGNLRWP